MTIPRQRRRFLQSFLVVALGLSQGNGLAYYHEYRSMLRRRHSIADMEIPSSRSSPITPSRLQASKYEGNVEDGEDDVNLDEGAEPSNLEKKLLQRMTRLEELVAKQEVELYRLRTTCSQLSETSEAFAKIIQLLKDSGLENQTKTSDGGSDSIAAAETKTDASTPRRVVESFDDSLIFGTAPSSVTDAADAAGAAILAAMLGGKQRMLVDVRDAELSTDPEILVQFIELAILPIAAGLEGLTSQRNRVKIVFPKVSQLLEYRRTMALAAPDVVALSTLGFDPVENNDNLVVIVAPAPDDDEGMEAMQELLAPSNGEVQGIQQPVVLLNHHMVPLPPLPVNFETAYHLRLLSVQYMTAGDANEFFKQFRAEKADEGVTDDEKVHPEGEGSDEPFAESEHDAQLEDEEIEDEELEAAMKHAREVGMNQGVTRAMVIRAYPRPWHVFVDTSPATDADFEVAATFDEEPTSEELNFAIVECLEGSEREDEIVAQQMQLALEEGQLDKVSDMIGEALEQHEEELDENDIDVDEADSS